ncbi:MAG TPA: peptide-methionine (S)-S-oxide reductase MsrA [Myxococcaceae bacterium]|nr:peptide-methionine (S)-S-oxide reductase MsrA [Myxococcaceae bacterium]
MRSVLFVLFGGVLLLAVLLRGALAAGSDGRVVPLPVGTRPGGVGAGTPLKPAPGHALAVFAQGCFWGTEYRFRQVPGVVATAVGYTGGTTTSPTYEQVSDHGMGHAESVLIEFDPAKVSYARLLEIFWSSHDSTSGNRQGPDLGSQYRSAIFTFDAQQQAQAGASRDAEQRKLVDPITTEIAPVGRFWIAEDYHQQWDEKHERESCPLPRHAKTRSGS